MGTSETFAASDGAQVNVYRAAPTQTGSAPGVVVFPSIFAVTDEVRSTVDELAAAGAVAVAFDPFSRGDAGPRGEGENASAFARLGDLDRKRASADFRELVADMRDRPGCNGRVLGIGVCLGGPFVWLAAADGLLDAGATWHGSRISAFVDRAADIRCPMSMHFGDADPVVPIENVDKIRAACAGVDHIDIQVHPGAGHGFSHTGWQAHDAAADTAARAGVRVLLDSLRAG